MHGGWDPKRGVAESSLESLIYDTSASRYTKECLKKGSIPEFQDDYVFVGAHNHNAKKPFVYQRYLMLGGNGPEQVFVFDLNSMACSQFLRGNKNLRPYRIVPVEV